MEFTFPWKMFCPFVAVWNPHNPLHLCAIAQYRSVLWPIQDFILQTSVSKSKHDAFSWNMLFDSWLQAMLRKKPDQFFKIQPAITSSSVTVGVEIGLSPSAIV